MHRRSRPFAAETPRVFERLARDYRERPGYPEDLVRHLAALAAGGPVVDLGAGTGALAGPLSAQGVEAWAVEPAEGMLKLCRERWPAVRPVLATAEDTGLTAGLFSAAILADAIQWVDPEAAGRESRRLLRPEGLAVLVEPAFAATPFMSELSVLLHRANPRARPAAAARGLQWLAVSAGGRPECAAFHSEVPLDAERLSAVLRSMSFVGPALGSEALAVLDAEAQALAARHGGALWSRRFEVRWATRARR